MPLVSMGPMLRAALSGRFAIGAFNPVDYSSMKAIVRTAEELDAPVIVQTSAKTVRYYGHETLVGWMRQLAGSSTVPVALHLDHGKDQKMIERCVETGWTSVMIDASDLPFEENLASSRRIVEIAKEVGVGVEAELGEIRGVEEDVVASEYAGLADPEKAVLFCEQLELAAFAPAIGTAHGIYNAQPKIAFDLAEKIRRRTQTPFALHGGTGLSDEVIQRCIMIGFAKINISTHLKYEFIGSFCDYCSKNPNDKEPLKVLAAQHDAVRAVIREKILQFGGEGKAHEVAGN